MLSCSGTPNTAISIVEYYTPGIQQEWNTCMLSWVYTSRDQANDSSITPRYRREEHGTEAFLVPMKYFLFSNEWSAFKDKVGIM